MNSSLLNQQLWVKYQGKLGWQSTSEVNNSDFKTQIPEGTDIMFVKTHTHTNMKNFNSNG